MEEAEHPNAGNDAMARVKTALARIEAAAEKVAQAPTPNMVPVENTNTSSAKVMALVNQHEAMREEVAVTMRELDTIISKLEM